MITRPAAALLGAAVVFSYDLPARACGGMVFPQHEERVGGMSDQELFVLFGADETVLVASAGYTGAAGEFAFILPLASEPLAVQDGDNALFIALDEYSAPRVAITVDSGEAPTALCGGAKDGGVPGGGMFGGDGDVMVHQRGSTATYDYVVIGGDTGTAVADWLSDAGYALPADYAAALDPYVESGSYFFAAKVKADVADGALDPIELHLPPGGPETFKIPFGIAAHSLAGAALRITTYFYAAGPVLPGNYAAQAVDVDQLQALSETESNYAEVEREILGTPGGAFVIDHSAAVSAAALRDAYDVARVDTGGTDPAYITDLFDRTGVPEAHLTRLRTEMSAATLGDLTLRRADGPEVQNYYSLTFDPDAGESEGACAIDRSGNLAQFLLLVPVLAWIRPRRRA